MMCKGRLPKKSAGAFCMSGNRPEHYFAFTAESSCSAVVRSVISSLI